jgi:hypothetical protein
MEGKIWAWKNSCQKLLSTLSQERLSSSKKVEDFLLEDKIDPIETELLIKILYSTPVVEFRRYQELIRKRNELGILTDLEDYDLRWILGLLDRMAIARNNALIDLAHLRKIPVQQLTEDLKLLEDEQAERARRRAASLRQDYLSTVEGS